MTIGVEGETRPTVAYAGALWQRTRRQVASTCHIYNSSLLVFFLITVAVEYTVIYVTNTDYNNATCIISFAWALITFGLNEDRVGDLVVCSLRPPSVSLLLLIFPCLPQSSYVLLIFYEDGTSIVVPF